MWGAVLQLVYVEVERGKKGREKVVVHVLQDEKHVIWVAASGLGAIFSLEICELHVAESEDWGLDLEHGFV